MSPVAQAVAPSCWRRNSLRMMRFGAYCYLGLFALLLTGENWLVYRPVSASGYWHETPAGWQDHQLVTAGGDTVHAWWCPVEGARGAVLYCHGTDGNLSHRTECIRNVQQGTGLSVLIFDYPGYGRSEGSPSERGCYAAAAAAYRWLRDEQGVAADDLVLFGDSLGGGVATYLATRQPHRGLILSKAFTSLPDVGQRYATPLLPVRWVMRNRFDNLGRIGRCPGPVFLGHGTADTLVPLVHGERLFAAANGPKAFRRLEGFTHTTTLPPDFFREALAFLDTHRDQTP